jgi:hypothetical protein
VFDQTVRDLQENPGFADELGVLFIDSVGDRLSERNLMLLGKNRIIAVVFLGHTTNLFHGLYLVLFILMKQNKDSPTNRIDHISTHAKIRRLMRA